jgi:hypothetical protein
MNKVSKAVSVLIMLLMCQCAPKIFHVDRHSLMEEEGSGKWPDFKAHRSKKGPSALPIKEEKNTELLKADQ